MELQYNPFQITLAEGMTCTPTALREAAGIAEYDFHLTWTAENAEKDDKFLFDWRTPQVGLMYKWTPSCGFHHNMEPDWGGTISSMISRSAPLSAFYDGQGINHYTWALSECTMRVDIQNGIIEENGNIRFRFTMGTFQFATRKESDLTIRIDTRPVPYRDTIQAVAAWWENEQGMTPAAVPPAAREPVYSFWYSYHQEITDKEVEEECRRAKELGFDICIIDDGWQTDDAGRGYAFCGDWEPAPSKFPDMKAHVARVHEIGMKYVIWYSVCFVGFHSKHYEHFKDKILRNVSHLGTAVLDPRYKEVRDFLLNIYKNALVEWNLDGFKLDFIDTWSDQPGDAPYQEGMDIPSLSEAVTVFMNTVIAELKAIKPDILLEFRQGYIGPVMKTFGNMFRVGDCPGDYISNRVGVFDLRMIMGRQAVHSDMLMWHPNESAERDALQIISIMYGVMQYSARLDSITPRVAKMSKFWLDFLKEHQATLLDGELRAYDPQSLYTWAEAIGESETIAAVYQAERLITPVIGEVTWIANGSECDRVLADLKGYFELVVYNCLGEVVFEDDISFLGTTFLPIPTGGIAKLRRTR
ncbi:MAG: alpha-galactosidase [Clostridia bacterium]|nr:alpha-galactosidase [Clostridia bacterium]